MIFPRRIINSFGGLRTYYHELKKRMLFESLFAPSSLIKNYDIVHVHDWYGVPMVLKGKTEGKIRKIVYSIHLSPYPGFTYQTLHAREEKQKKYEFGGILYSDAVIVASEYMKRSIHKYYGVEKSNIEVIPLGVDSDFFKPGKPKKNLILTVSRLTEQKGIEYLLKAIDILKRDDFNLKLLIVGDGDLKGYLLKLAKELEVPVEFKGNVSKRTLSRLYRSAYLYVTSSIYEPFGLSILEAMASGLPIVGFNISAIPEIVRNKTEGLLVTAGSYRKLAKAIKILLEDSDLRSYMATNARRRAMCYTWEKHVKKLQEVYKNV